MTFKHTHSTISHILSLGREDTSGRPGDQKPKGFRSTLKVDYVKFDLINDVDIGKT